VCFSEVTSFSYLLLAKFCEKAKNRSPSRNKFEAHGNDRGSVILILTTTKFVKSIEAYDILGQLQLHAGHSFRTLVSGFWFGRAECIGNSQAVERDITRLSRVQHTVVFQLAKKLHTQKTVKGHEE